MKNKEKAHHSKPNNQTKQTKLTKFSKNEIKVYLQRKDILPFLSLLAL
jgi:hypothetical protein